MKAKLLNCFSIPDTSMLSVTVQLPKKDGGYWYLSNLVSNDKVFAKVNDYCDVVANNFKVLCILPYKES